MLLLLLKFVFVLLVLLVAYEYVRYIAAWCKKWSGLKCVDLPKTLARLILLHLLRPLLLFLLFTKNKDKKQSKADDLQKSIYPSMYSELSSSSSSHVLDRFL